MAQGTHICIPDTSNVYSSLVLELAASEVPIDGNFPITLGVLPYLFDGCDVLQPGHSASQPTWWYASNKK